MKTLKINWEENELRIIEICKICADRGIKKYHYKVDSEFSATLEIRQSITIEQMQELEFAICKLNDSICIK